MKRDDELARLIASQRADDRRGAKQPREPIVALSLDAFDEQPGRLTARVVECFKHGPHEVRWTPSGWWWCRVCARERAREKRAAARARNGCPHGRTRKLTCNACGRKRDTQRRREAGVEPRRRCTHGEARKQDCRACCREKERAYKLRKREAAIARHQETRG